MKNHRQNDFPQGLGCSHPLKPINYRYNPLIARRIKHYQQRQAVDARVRYGQEHAEPGEVYLMLGLL